MSFGFSASDIIAASKLVFKFYKIFQGSDGSSYHDFMLELRSLYRVLIEANGMTKFAGDDPSNIGIANAVGNHSPILEGLEGAVHILKVLE